MNLKRRIEVLTQLGAALKNKTDQTAMAKMAFARNNWFTIENTQNMLQAIADNYLSAEKLQKWMAEYDFSKVDETPSKTVGLVMAGNIPLVGFHDFLSVFICGHKPQIKLSEKDDKLMPYLYQLLLQIDREVKNEVAIVPQLKGFDAVIATGSNNSARYFHYYFGKYPHIIRKNRGSVAVLSGQETKDDIYQLGKDIFQYFGLGCRSVSKLMVPEGYNFDFLLGELNAFKEVSMHSKYRNNFDYHLAIYLLDKVEHLVNDAVIVIEKEAIGSPAAVLHYEYYTDETTLRKRLEEQEEDIQCVVGSSSEYLDFGQAQKPELWDYADKVDTVEFLLGL
ncbi:MAG: acyl-CoA reductase [Chitinophagales bacterium]